MEKQEEQTTDLVVSSGRAWRQARERGEVVRLPSGNVVRLRAVALDAMILAGDLPDLLTPIAAKSLWTEANETEIGNSLSLAKGYAELVHRIIPLAMMDPRVVDNPTADDEITLADLDFGDKVAIFQIATQPAEVLARFRAQQAAVLAAIHHGQNNGHTPE